MKKVLAVVGIGLWAGLVMGMDPEQDTIVIDPPKIPKPRTPFYPEPPKLELQLPVIPHTPRIPFVLDGPFLLDLQMPDFVSRPEKGKPDETDRVNKRLEGQIRELKARTRVVTGQIHPDHVSLGHQAEENWKPSLSQIPNQDMSKPGFSWFGAQIWQRMQDAPESIGDGFVDPLSEEAFLSPDRFLARPERKSSRKPLQNVLAQAPRSNQVQALFEVHFDVHGLATAHLRQSSGYRLYDEAALEALLAAIAESSNFEMSMRSSRVLYAASSHIQIHSRLPVAGLGLDLVLPLLDPIIPANKSLTSRFEVLTVEPTE